MKHGVAMQGKSHAQLVRVVSRLLLLLLIALDCNPSAAFYFEKEPEDQEVIRGGLAILACTVANRGNESLYWRYINEEGTFVPLSENRDIAKYKPMHGELSARLSIKGDPNHGEYNLYIKDVSLADQRHYVCSVGTERVLRDSRPASIIIRPGHPLDPQQPDPLPACHTRVVSTPRVYQIGAIVRFTCALPEGTPHRELVWRKVGHNRTRLVSCPRSPCEHNQPLTIDDVDMTFVCDVTGQDQQPIECTHTPLESQTVVVVDPPVSRLPAGHREGFVCFPVNYSANDFQFQWYRGSQLLQNGTDASMINLLIDWSDADSTLSCVISTHDGAFFGIGHASIVPYDPRDDFPDIEGSSSPSPSTPGFGAGQTTDRQNVTLGNIARDTSVIPVTYTPPPTDESPLTKPPLGEIGNTSDSSVHLSMLIVVSAVAGALVTLLLCALFLVILLFARKKRKNIISAQENGIIPNSAHGASGTIELRSLDPLNSVDICEEQQTTYSDVGSDLFYATVDPSKEEQYIDGTLCKTVNKVSQPADMVPSTPNDYARPQTTPLEDPSKTTEGMVKEGSSRNHERPLSDSSANAYAVTALISQEGRFVFKGMTGRDEADVGVCRLHALDRSATMSKAHEGNPSAPPLPARTLPRTMSTPGAHGSSDNSYNQRLQSESTTTNDKVSGSSKNSFLSRWASSVKGKKRPSRDSPVSSPSEEITPVSSDDHRPLSCGSGASGDYAEIVSIDSVRSGSPHRVDSGLSPSKRQSFTRDRLDSIPERAASSNQYQDLEAHAPSSNILESQSLICKDTSTSSEYDRLARPNHVLISPVKTPSPIPIYAKVQKSKSLDHDGPRKLGDGTATPGLRPPGRRGRPATTTGMSHLLRSMSEGTAPPKPRKPRSVCGYETVGFECEDDGLDSVSGRLSNILIQMRNGFPGVDEPEEPEEPGELTGGEIKGNTGGHLAKIV